MTSSFRPVDTEDYPLICSLVRSEEELFLLYPKGRFPLTPVQLARLVQRRVASTVVVVDGQVAGFANFYGYKAGRYAYIGNVLIDPARRGEGLGRELVSYMIRLAFEEHQLAKIKISVYNSNTAALLLYTSMGFKVRAVREREDLAGNRVALIQLSLRQIDWDMSTFM